jgi:uncharacterized membrane protein
LRHVVFTLLTLSWPLVVWLANGRLEPRWLALGLVVLGVVRLLTSTAERTWVVVGIAALALAGLAAALNVGWPLKLYPVVISASMLALFGATLIKGPPMVERLARLREPDLPAHAIAYTRQVTKVWCGFFVLNGALAAGLALFASERAWALYTGGIAYGLMGALFAGEWLVRQRVRRRHEGATS